MPNRDGTGPQGKGSMTGKGMGACKGGKNLPFESQQGKGCGKGEGGGCGEGRRGKGRGNCGKGCDESVEETK